MLAQNFKSAAELDITEQQFDALRKTLVLLETGKLVHVPGAPDLSPDYETNINFSGKFNMSGWNDVYHGCGTVSCIGGTAELIGNVDFKRIAGYPGTQINALFYPIDVLGDWTDITPAQAATALRSYLTCGDAKWREAIA